LVLEGETREVNPTKEKAGVSGPALFGEHLAMYQIQATQGRQARSVRMITPLPVRLQEKTADREKLSDATIVWIGTVKVLLGISATGELVIEPEPP
jgi:hypothetical protein